VVLRSEERKRSWGVLFLGWCFWLVVCSSLMAAMVLKGWLGGLLLALLLPGRFKSVFLGCYHCTFIVHVPAERVREHEETERTMRKDKTPKNRAASSSSSWSYPVTKTHATRAIATLLHGRGSGGWHGDRTFLQILHRAESPRHFYRDDPEVLG